MEGYFDYMALYLAQPTIRVEFKMMTSANTEPDHYPVIAYDVNGGSIGTAANKSGYITLWNSIQSNATVGKLIGGYGPFSFILLLKPGVTPPSKVTGDPIHQFAGIFSNAFGSEFN